MTQYLPSVSDQNYTRKMFRIDHLSADVKERIIEKDKSQYLQWLHGVR